MGGRGNGASRNSSGYNYIENWKKDEVKAVVDELNKWREKDLKWRETEPLQSRVALERNIPTAYYQTVTRRYKDEESKDKVFQGFATQLVDSHFEALKSKVESTIGEITHISRAGGANDYDLIGKSGEAVRIQVVMAGGYNKQRLHTRWIMNHLGKRKKGDK